MSSDQIFAALAEVFGVNPMSGGDGSEPGKAVVIHRGAPNDVVGTEYAYLSEFLKDQPDWVVSSQSTSLTGDRRIDALEVNIAPGVTKHFYFDITEAY